MTKTLTRIVLAVALAAPALSFASDDEYSGKSLRGLRGVYVLVEDLRPEVEQAGLTKAMIQTDAELKLRLAGIRVLTQDENLKEPGMPYLYLRATVFQSSPKSWRFSVTVELTQYVQLTRNPAIVVGAHTWSSERLNGIAPSADMPQMVRSDSKDLVDQFINAYLAVNPKK